MKKVLLLSILAMLSLSGCAKIKIWFGMGESAGVDYSACEELQTKAKDTEVPITERQEAMKELSSCRKDAEAKFLESQK